MVNSMLKLLLEFVHNWFFGVENLERGERGRGGDLEII